MKKSLHTVFMLNLMPTRPLHKRRALVFPSALRLGITALVFSLTSCSPAIPDGPVIVPTPQAKAIDQILIDKNGCGPTALMNSYRFGSPAWHIGYEKLGNKVDATEKQKFTDLVNRFGIHISRHNGMIRWDKRSGISAPDLSDMANDFQRARRTNLPNLSVKTHFVTTGQADLALLQDTHKKLRDSMLRGFPPIMTIKRFAHRSFGNYKIWKQIHGHFVVLHEIPGKIAPDATSFDIKYIDPWGGKIHKGTIKIPEQSYYAIDSTRSRNVKFQRTPALLVHFPNSRLGNHLLRKNERNVTILASSISP